MNEKYTHISTCILQVEGRNQGRKSKADSHDNA